MTATSAIENKPTQTVFHLSQFLSGSGVAGAGLVLGGLFTVLTGVVFARWLQPEHFGICSLALAVISLLGGLGAAGMDTMVARFVAFYCGDKRDHLVVPVIKFGVRWASAISVLLALVVGWMLRASFVLPANLRSLGSIAPFISLAIPVCAILLVLQQAVLGLGGIKARIVIEKIMQPSLRLLLPFLLLPFFGNRLSAALAGVVAAAICCLFAASVVLHRLSALLPIGGTSSRKEIRSWSGYALPLAFQSLQQFVSNGLGIDILLVGALASISASGIYAAAFRFTPLLTLVRSAMDYAFGPRVSALFGQSDLHSIDVLYKTSSTLGLMFTLPFGIILVLFSRPIMTTFFGASYADGATALALLVCGCVIDSATGCNTTLLAMIGKPWLVLLNGLIGGVLTVLLCWVLIPPYGIAGAAFSVTVSRASANLLATAQLWNSLRALPFSRKTLKLMIPATLMATCAFAARNYLSTFSQLSLPLLAVTGVFLLGVYVLGVWILGLTSLQYS
jgi:O-antigen/teichoic acid export membrane protein